MTFENFKIRLIQLEDAEQFLKLVSSNKTRISTYLPKTANSVYDKTSTDIFIEEKIKSADKKEHYCFVIENQQELKLEGTIFLKNFDWSVPKAEVGYFIDKNSQGKGLMTKAVAEIIKYCFEVLKLNKLFLRTSVDNFSSKKTAEKNGFSVEGILRKDYKNGNGVLIDVVYYGLLKE